MLRYVVLRHEIPHSARAGVHWDLMLECDGVLRTWALALEPTANREITAESLPDHRLDYLEYEGPISGNRGEVRQWDQGQYEMQSDTENEIRLAIDGQQLAGTVSLRRQQDNHQRWIFFFSTFT